MGWCGAGVHRSRRLHRLHHRGLRAQLLRILHTDHSSHTSGRRSAIPAFRPVREPHPSNTSATPHPSNGAPRHPFSALDLPELLVAIVVRFWLAVFVFPSLGGFSAAVRYSGVWFSAAVIPVAVTLFCPITAKLGLNRGHITARRYFISAAATLSLAAFEFIRRVYFEFARH